MQQTISENFNINLEDTFSVSCLLGTSKVKSLLNIKNSQVTKALNSLVGTSETIRLLNQRSIHNLSNSDKDLKFKQWLAGLIDGDGCFSLSKKGYATRSLRNYHGY